MQIDPKVALWIKAIYVVLTGLSATALSAAGVADPQKVIAIAGLVAFPLGVLLQLYSSSTPGPLAPPDSPAVKAATAEGVKALALLALLTPLAVAALSLGACNALSPATISFGAQTALAIAETVDPALIAKADKTIAQLSKNDLSKACAIFGQADSYYTALKPAIAADVQARGAAYESAGQTLCASPPSDVGSGLATLNRLWIGLQAATAVSSLDGAMAAPVSSEGVSEGANALEWALRWGTAVFSGGALFGLVKTAAKAGALTEKQERHAADIEGLKQQLAEASRNQGRIELLVAAIPTRQEFHEAIRDLREDIRAKGLSGAAAPWKSHDPGK